MALTGTDLAKASANTIRLSLFKVGAGGTVPDALTEASGLGAVRRGAHWSS